MAVLPESISLNSVVDDQDVPATIVSLTRDLAKLQIDARWWAEENIPKSLRGKEIDHGWNWSKTVGEMRNKNWYEAVAVQTTDGAIQGAMRYRIDGSSFLSTDEGAVFVEGLATAPWNRPWLVKLPRFRGVGEALLQRAAYHSYTLGFHGRVNLISADE